MLVAKKIKQKFTYADYVKWPDNERWELIDGEAYDMSPAPSFSHQKVVGNIYRILGNQLAGKKCIPGIAPTDIILSEYDVVQPDVFVVCDKKKITEANIQGAPDVIIEVLSPSTGVKDRREKKALYERFGVREYILVDLVEKYVESFYLMEEGTYSKGNILGADEILPFRVLDKVEIPLREVFE
ncbi:MAG: Uma2 family endonuclease [bacterium]